MLDALRGAGVDADLRDADAALLAALAEASYDAVFVALHGGAGEDGALREVLELAGVPYVGSHRPTPAGSRGTSRPPRPSWRGPGCRRRTAVVLPHATFRELGAPRCSTVSSSTSACR